MAAGTRPARSVDRLCRVGTRRLYRVHPTGLAALRGYVESFWTDVLGAYAQAAAEATGTTATRPAPARTITPPGGTP